MRISKLTLKNGNLPLLEVDLRNITILVGPNNSGKSQAIREIDDSFAAPGQPTTVGNRKILAGLEFELPNSYEDVIKLIELFKSEPPKNLAKTADQIYFSIVESNQSPAQPISGFITLKQISEQINTKPKKILNLLKSKGILRGCCARLDSQSRFNITSDKPRGDILQPPRNLFAYLFQNEEVEKELRKIIHYEFSRYLYLDPTKGDFLRVVMSLAENPNPKSLKKKEAEFFRNADLLANLGDGIKAFTGLLLAVINPQYQVVLIDDPEAFLHPPKALSLGRHLATFMKDRNGSLVVSTHSAEFLMGCLETTSELTIIRLTFDGITGTARQLKSEDLIALSHDPLLRSTNVMDALFHSSAIVVEGDADRVFYSEINRKLVLEEKGIMDVLFIKAIGKDTVHRIVALLRKIGIPTACIYDLDVIRKESHEYLWNNILQSANIPTEQHAFLEAERKFCDNAILKRKGEPDPKKTIGIEALSGTDKERAENLLNTVKKYGVFIVPVGEVECWLNYLYKADKRDWIENILDKLNEPSVMPTDKDVWKFINDINDWMEDTKRLGCP